VDRSEGDDEELYPSAPVPAHERGWRHPSEIGQAAWANSEPPLTIGRGLSAATGAVGALLAIAVLWAVVPTVISTTTAVYLVDTSRVPATTTSAATATTIDPGTGTTSGTSPSVTTPPQSTTPGATTTLPSSTIDTQHDPHTDTAATYQIEQASPRLPNAVAVAIAGGTLVLTTANAVTRGDNVALMMDNGNSEPAHVIMVDNRDGLAVLTAEAPMSVGALHLADTVTKGDVLTFVGEQRLTVTVGDGGSIDPAWAHAQVREGTPVLNQRGELVAMCSRGDDGMRVVMLVKLTALRAAIAAEAASRTVWLGVTLDQQPDSLRITTVAMKGPAANAGITAGDTIVAIDGSTVGSRSHLAEILHKHHPGDTVRVTVRADDATERSVTVELAAPSSAP
jgi:S1-C subfamily serine protease